MDCTFHLCLVRNAERLSQEKALSSTEMKLAYEKSLEITRRLVLSAASPEKVF